MKKSVCLYYIGIVLCLLALISLLSGAISMAINVILLNGGILNLLLCIVPLICATPLLIISFKQSLVDIKSNNTISTKTAKLLLVSMCIVVIIDIIINVEIYKNNIKSYSLSYNQLTDSIYKNMYLSSMLSASVSFIFTLIINVIRLVIAIFTFNYVKKDNMQNNNIIVENL